MSIVACTCGDGLTPCSTVFVYDKSKPDCVECELSIAFINGHVGGLNDRKYKALCAGQALRRLNERLKP